MKPPSTFRKYSSAGIDWAAWLLGIGLGLTLALQLTTMSHSDISSVYAVVASVTRAAALVGTYFAIVGIFLVARIPWVERGVGHDRLVTWHRKLGPWSLYLIGFHVLFITDLASKHTLEGFLWLRYLALLADAHRYVVKRRCSEFFLR